jgi:hypothetical protein
MPRLRFQPPDRLLGAAKFSASDDLRGSLNAVKLVKSQKWVWDELREACDLEVNYARYRDPGHWELACIAYITSGQVDVQPWWDNASDELWNECGFEVRPSYATTWRRLAELEDVCDEFLHSAAKVIQRCREHDPRVFAHAHIDWTEDETHAQLIHDCREGDKCKYPEQAGPRRASTEAAREIRQDLAEQTQEDAEAQVKKYTPNKAETVIRKGRKYKRIRMNGCWFITRDFDAGIRSYTGPEKVSRRMWHGYASGKLIDHFTGGVIPSVDSASKQEFKIFPELFDQGKEMIGQAPETITADRGVSLSECYEHATRAGTAPIFPWRVQTGEREPADRIEYDRHGVKRCAGCGGPMQQTKFSTAKGQPRLWFRCQRKLTPACEKDQTISCSTNWRFLVPLAQTEGLYHELQKSHATYEATHLYWRNRYRVGSDVLANRSKRVGIGCHRLRANVACFVDWLKIAARCGWLGSTRNKTRHPGDREFQESAEETVKELLDERGFLGLSGSYGPAALRLGFKIGKPPSTLPPPTPI